MWCKHNKKYYLLLEWKGPEIVGEKNDSAKGGATCSWGVLS